MKVLHTSDWHLGMTESTRPLVEDQQFFINEICRIAEEERVEAVILAGDIFDRSVSPAWAVQLYDETMTRLCLKMKKQVLVIAGNHDGAERLASCHELLAEAGLHILGSLDREPAMVSVGDTDFYLMPWFTEEKVKSLFPEKREEIRSLEDAFRVVTEAAKATFKLNRKHIAISHAFITGASTSTSDRTAEIGFASQVPADVFDGFDYVALGHIHGPQSVTDRVRYSGTPMAYSFGKEESQEKSVVILDTETMEQKMVPLARLHNRLTITDTFDAIMSRNWPDEIRNAYVNVKVTDIFLGLTSIARLRELFPNLMEFAGKNFEADNSSISLTLEEFERIESNPADIFTYFCKEIMEAAPSQHQLEMFERAVRSREEVAE